MCLNLRLGRGKIHGESDTLGNTYAVLEDELVAAAEETLSGNTAGCSTWGVSCTHCKVVRDGLKTRGVCGVFLRPLLAETGEAALT